MYCKNCGKNIDDDSIYCKNCEMQLNNYQKQTVSDDKPSFGFAVLGFFIPIVGLILFIRYKNEQPKRAKSAGKGVLFRSILSIILVIIYKVIQINKNDT